MRSLVLLPWKTRLVALLVWPVVIAGPALLQHGTAPSPAGPHPEVMSGGWVLLAWVLAAPFLAGEVAAAVRGHQRAAQVCAVVTAFVLAAVASLPITFRLGPAGPLADHWLQVAATTYGVLVVGSVVGAVAACSFPSRRRRAAHR